ncbi:MAG TPA: Na+/H+ antiporter subunit E [Spirochaetota bacterium]|nr:Na+/H+ antiporter subunit E [Spirochaetota bacterium]
MNRVYTKISTALPVMAGFTTVWLCLTNSLEPVQFISGLFLAAVLTFLFIHHYQKSGLPPISPPNIFYFTMYLFVLFIEIVKANFDLAYRVIHPRMPINPGLVVIKTSLKQDLAKMILANSITLTPGTFTIDIKGDQLLIHWINVKKTDQAATTKIIASRFEKYLEKLFN